MNKIPISTTAKIKIFRCNFPKCSKKAEWSFVWRGRWHITALHFCAYHTDKIEAFFKAGRK